VWRPSSPPSTAAGPRRSCDFVREAAAPLCHRWLAHQCSLLLPPLPSPPYASVMRYTMKQKFFSFGDDYRVQDEDGEDRYIIDGSALSLRNSTSIRDTGGEEVAHLHRRLLSLGPTYEIERNGRTTVVHKHLFTLFHCTFSIDVPGPDDLVARGNFLDMEYEF